MSFDTNVVRCQVCNHKRWKNGEIVCSVSNTPIFNHAEQGDCPKGYYTEGGKLPQARKIPVQIVSFAALWFDFHNRPFRFVDAKSEVAWLQQFGRQLPCGDCSTHYTQMLKRTLPDFSSRLNYARWTWERHNEVSRRIGKAELPWEQAAVLYGYSKL